MSNKTIGLYAKHSHGKEWTIVEMRENGGETNIRNCEGEPVITNCGDHAIIRYANGCKDLYTFDPGHFRGL
jgi:hypothetical protein